MLDKTNVPVARLYAHGSNSAPPLPPDLQAAGITYIKCMNKDGEHPIGPNTMFAAILHYFAAKGYDGPLFLCEPDGFPRCADWYARVLGSHVDTGKNVSGSWIGWVDPVHYNGNLVIETRMLKLYPWIGRVVVDAWDCFHAELFATEGAPNPNIVNPRRQVVHYPLSWWHTVVNAQGKVPAWVHGCQSFAAWEHIAEIGFPAP
jgi:hypothetical protein